MTEENISNAEKRDRNYKRMGKMPIKKLIVSLSIPSIVSMMISTFYNMADTYFVSLLGTSASAAVGVIFPLMAILQAVGMCFAAGAGVYISRLLGEKNKNRASETLSTAWFTTFAIGIIFSVVGLLGVNELVQILGATETIMPYALDYCSVILFGSPIIMVSFVMNNILRSEGNSFFAMIGIGIGAVINIALDPLFIFGFNMGISGAALATIISQTVSFTILLVYFIMKKSALNLNIRLFRFDLKLYIEIIKMGMPSLFRQGLASLSMVILNNVAAPYGDYVIASVSIINRVTFFSQSIMLGFSQGYLPVAGYNYGAKLYKRLWDSFVFTGIVLLGIALANTLVLTTFSEEIITIFRKDDSNVIALGAFGLFWAGIFMPFKAIGIFVTFTFQSLGRGIPSTLLAMSTQGLALIPAILILPYFFNERALPLAYPAADIISTAFLALPFLIYLIRELRKNLKLNENETIS